MPDWYVQAADAGGTGVVNSNTKFGNIMKGGQLGVGAKYTMLDAATPAVWNPTVFIVTGTPTMWEYIPGGATLRFMLKALVETHARNITGVDFGYSNEAQGTPVGHDGQEANVPTQTKRSQVNPSITFNEIVGGVVYNIGRRWLFDMQHPDTNMSLMSAQLMNDGNADTQIPPFLYSSFSMSMLGIQFDPTGRPENILDAAFYTNMFPTEIGEVGFERTHGQTSLKERTWTMKALVQHNSSIKDMAYEIAKLINAHKVDYNYATPGFKMEQALVSANGANAYGGFKYDVEDIVKNYTKNSAITTL